VNEAKQMPANYSINPEKLSSFKEPFGKLIKGTPAETMRQLAEILKKQKPLLLISVGDTVSRNLHEHNLIPQLSITDDKSMRKKLSPVVFHGKTLVHVKNPEGTITEEAIQAIQRALKTGEATQILVDGEEDMLTLIVVLYAPENALVVYGQPSEGIVVVQVTARKRAEATQIWESMLKTQTK
jgi:GTP-dependent dephospho-CoA kinase